MLQGDPIYDLGTDHATWNYGPLTTVVLALAFEFTGPTLVLGRLVSAISGTAVVILLAAIFGNRDRLTFAIAIALLLGVNGRSAYYFTETRPDMTYIFFTLLALIVLYHGQESKGPAPRAVLTAAGCGLLMISFMFKQTALAFAFVPMLAILPQFGKMYFRKQLVFAAMPVAAGLVTVGALWYLSPGLWHFMVVVLAQYRISIHQMGRGAFYLLASAPLFLLALVHWLYTDARNDWQSPRIRWLMAAMACAIPSSAAAYGKEGGDINSLIPAFLCIGTFCAWRSPAAVEPLRDDKRPFSLRAAAGVLLSVLLFAHAFPARTSDGLPGWQLKFRVFASGWGVSDRGRVIAETRLLPGKIVCPDDPTIPLMAKGYAGRTLNFEADATQYNLNRSQALQKEIQSADYVIAMRGSYYEVIGWDWDNVLKSAGFTKSRFSTTSSSVYELWRRVQQPAMLSTPPR
jgi:4-amino-4-deoxy-L-arabinose transferase-like glycosyltransferase